MCLCTQGLRTADVAEDEPFKASVFREACLYGVDSVKHEALVQRRYCAPRHRVTVWASNKNIMVPVKPHCLEGIA